MDDLTTEVRLAAIEFVLGTLVSTTFLDKGLSLEQVADVNRSLLRSLRVQSLAKTTDPAMSDHLSAEVVEHVERILAGIEAQVAAVRKQGP